MLSSTLATNTSLSTKSTLSSHAVGVWSLEEHDRFLNALKKFPHGPWKAITEYIATRSVRQVQTHAQKYQEKVSRRLHGIQTGKIIRLRREHRIDHDVFALHTIISSSSDLRNKHVRRSPVEVKRVVVVTPSRTAAKYINTELQRPTLTPVELEDKSFGFITDNDGASPSSVTSCFRFQDVNSALEELPTLDESLDFFIQNLS